MVDGKGRGTNCSLWTHIEGLGGVVGFVLDEERWLRGSETVFSYWGCGEGDLLEVGYVVFLGVGAAEGGIIEGSNEGLGNGQEGKEKG